MRVNGLPMRTLAFESALAPPEVIKFYLNNWRGNPGEISSEKRVADWSVVAYSHGTFHTTVQVKPSANGRGSMGYIGTTSQDGSERPDFSNRGLPQPSGMRVMSAIESDDGGRRAVQVTMSGRTSVSMASSYYDATLRREGWVPERSPKATADRPDQIYATYNRGVEQLDVMFVRDLASGDTVVHASRVGPK